MTGAEQFARNLYLARGRAGFSRAELARRSGMSSDGIYKLENGHRSPELATIRLLAKALSVRPGELLEGLRL